MRFSIAALSILAAFAAITVPGAGVAQEPAPATQPAPEPAPASAPDWQRLFPGSNRAMTLSWDRASVARDGDVVRVTVRAEAGFIAGGSNHGDFLYEFRCADSKWRVIRTTNYTEAGEPLVEEAPRARFASIGRGTYMETIRAAVC